FPAVLFPEEHWNSEGLLALPEFQNIQGKKIALIRGENGRELLADTLQQRGATVTHIVTYRRTLPDLDPAPYKQLLREAKIDIIVTTSKEGVQHLYELMGPLVTKVPLLVISASMQPLA